MVKINIPNPVGLSTNTGFQIGKLWVIGLLIGIILAVVGIILSRSRR